MFGSHTNPFSKRVRGRAPKDATVSVAGILSNAAFADFNQLTTDLKAGNTTAAQPGFTKLQQDFLAHHRRFWAETPPRMR
jgi:hypothetical protein